MLGLGIELGLGLWLGLVRCKGQIRVRVILRSELGIAIFDIIRVSVGVAVPPLQHTKPNLKGNANIYPYPTKLDNGIVRTLGKKYFASR